MGLRTNVPSGIAVEHSETLRQRWQCDQQHSTNKQQYEVRSNVTTITVLSLNIFELTANVQCCESGVTGQALTDAASGGINNRIQNQTYRICLRNLRTFFPILTAEKLGCVKYADFFVEVLIWVLF